MGKRGASSRYIAAGLVSTEIAEKVTALSGCTKMSEMVLVMSEKSLAHANSEKHHQGGVGLTKEQYAQLSRIIAEENLVVLDKFEGHNNLIYFSADRQIKVVVEPGINPKRLKPKENVDGIINAYKVLNYQDVLETIKGGQYVVLKGEP